jgi:dipeptidyl aminopeptidase/acylaminoacyl peptidase
VKTLLLMIAAFPAVAGAAERVLTTRAAGHLIHNSQVFSRDGRHIVFDSRNDETQLAGSARIGMVEIASGKETVIYETSRSSPHGPGVGAATFSPTADEVVFIHGLDHAGPEQPYAAHRRSAALVSLATPGKMARLDARDATAPFTPGALRGGTHAHHWSGDGRMLSFTYNDAVVPAPGPAPADLRTIGVIDRRTPVTVAAPRSGEEFSGLGFTVLLVPVKATPAPGELSRACEEGWVGTKGYLRADGSRQKRALAFIGSTVAADGKPIAEVFIADLPDDLTRPGAAPLEGTSTEMPAPPAGVVIRRLTYTESTPRPGLQGPRHWLRASPDGTVIAFLDEDADGIVQIFGVSPNGGEPRPLSRLPQSVDTPFTWSPCGRFLATSAGGRIVRILAATGAVESLTPPSAAGRQPRHGVVFSPDGKHLAYNRLLPHSNGGNFLQICLLSLSAHR